jgi:hypothetical protein
MIGTPRRGIEMTERPPRLGDLVDDYCSRCRLVMNHGVVGIVGEQIKRVRCGTCLSEHAYRRGRVPKKKKDEVKELFDQVLASIPGARAVQAPERQEPPAPPEEPERPQPEIPRRPRSLHLGLREKMAELRARAEAAAAPAAEPEPRGGRPRRRRGRRGGRRRRRGRG